MVLYCSLECWGWILAELEQTWKYMGAQCCTSFHPCRSIRKQIWPCLWEFLAHLSRKAHKWAYSIGKPLSTVGRYVFWLHFQTSSPLKPLSRLKPNFHVEPPWDGGTKVYSNGPGHMTKIAAMHIYGKNLKKFSSPEPKGRWPWNLVCSIGCYQVCSNDYSGLTLTCLFQGQIWSIMLLYG